LKLTLGDPARKTGEDNIYHFFLFNVSLGIS
jgi:hypothetical protein